MVEMQVYGLAVESDTETPVLVLKSDDLGIMLPIWIGAMEAMAISMVLNEVSFPRPMTHDLLLSTIATFDGEVVSVDIVDIDKGTFYAEIMVRKDGDLVAIDSRPSDAVALAVRADCPVRVSQKVLDVAGTKDIEEKVEEKSGWDDELEGLSPDDFKYKM
ncbi:bifunctional nuclease family protein [Desulfovibrio sp. JC010]|uniref:bifunctional nuclease family protein n=1 Tax=Desulfovibrio sp. JC010 TaxID=2593641 RepID=UPI0013CF7FF8|nr:bifunctional nuclease family protein [Desulfovibrio sp. JC010]NDV28463.1 bifunctional nuclease family protein [Desulfovibrio sp. JC010]